MAKPTPEQAAQMLNSRAGGFNALIGLRFVRASADEVVAEIPITTDLAQPYGLVHGGVYASLVETICSVGAACDVAERGGGAVGLDNHTSFLSAAKEGTLVGRATPLRKGRRTQVWEARIEDQRGKLVARGQVRMLVLDEGSSILNRA
ncbi:MAG: PaaI family thioesterase [Myxococcales bacterium]|nr:PaaI family thioesterase [Myxococcales bacterium]